MPCLSAFLHCGSPCRLVLTPALAQHLVVRKDLVAGADEFIFAVSVMTTKLFGQEFEKYSHCWRERLERANAGTTATLRKSERRLNAGC